MVKITYSPIKEIIVHEISEKSPEEFHTLLIQQAQAQGAVGITPQVVWVHGVAFTFGFYPETPEITKEKLEGKIHYGNVIFALVPEFRADNVIRIQGTEYHVHLLNSESNPNFCDLADFLKARSWATDTQTTN